MEKQYVHKEPQVRTISSPSTRKKGNTRNIVNGSEVDKKMIQRKTEIAHVCGDLLLPNSVNERVGIGMQALLDPEDPIVGSEPDPNQQQNLMQYLREYIPGITFIRGHLLNADLGGIGKDYNMIPLTSKANSEHKNLVEMPIKHALAIASNQGLKINYTVEVLNPMFYETEDEKGYAADLICNAEYDDYQEPESLEIIPENTIIHTEALAFKKNDTKAPCEDRSYGTGKNEIIAAWRHTGGRVFLSEEYKKKLGQIQVVCRNGDTPRYVNTGNIADGSLPSPDEIRQYFLTDHLDELVEYILDFVRIEVMKDCAKIDIFFKRLKLDEYSYISANETNYGLDLYIGSVLNSLPDIGEVERNDIPVKHLKNIISNNIEWLIKNYPHVDILLNQSKENMEIVKCYIKEEMGDLLID